MRLPDQLHEYKHNLRELQKRLGSIEYPAVRESLYASDDDKKPEWGLHVASRSYMAGNWDESISTAEMLMSLFLGLGEVEKFQASASLFGLALLKKGDVDDLLPLYDLLAKDSDPLDPFSRLLKIYYLARMEQMLGLSEQATNRFRNLLYRTDREPECIWMKCYAMLDFYGLMVQLGNYELNELHLFFVEQKKWYDSSIFDQELSSNSVSIPGRKFLYDCFLHYLREGVLPPSIIWREIKSFPGPSQPDVETSFLLEWLKMMRANELGQFVLSDHFRANALYWARKTHCSAFLAAVKDPPATRKELVSGGGIAEEIHASPITLTTTPDLTFRFFGGFEVWRGETKLRLPPFKRKKSKEILAYLLLQPRYQCSKDVLIDQFFDEDRNGGNNNYMYVNIHSIRKWLRETTRISVKWVEMRDGLVQLWEDGIAHVDIEQFLQRSRVGDQLWTIDRQEAVNLYEKAFVEYKNPIAPEWIYSDWMERIYNQLYGKFQHISTRLVKNYTDQKHWDKALSTMERYLELYPLEENMIQIYAETLMRLDMHQDAKRIVDQYKKNLWDELQITPSDTLELCFRRTQREGRQ